MASQLFLNKKLRYQYMGHVRIVGQGLSLRWACPAVFVMSTLIAMMLVSVMRGRCFVEVSFPGCFVIVTTKAQLFRLRVSL